MKNYHRSNFSNLSNWKEKAWKNQGFSGIRTRDLHDTGAMLYQLSYEATYWRSQFTEFISSVRSEICVKYIWNNSYLNCGCRYRYTGAKNVDAVKMKVKNNQWSMCGFIAQLVQHRTGIAEATGFESRWIPDFQFRLLLSSCLNWKIYCDDHSALSLRGTKTYVINTSPIFIVPEIRKRNSKNDIWKFEL